MKFPATIVMLSCFFSSLVFGGELNLMPYPQSLSIDAGSFRLDKNITVSIKGDNPAQLTVALERFFARVKLQTGMQVRAKTISENAKFVIGVQSVSKSDVPFLAIDESYDLTINSEQIILNANSEVGALRGMETLLQLIGLQHHTINLPSVTIKDFPRFKWRGVLLDCSRHFFSVATIKRQLDAMAVAKYNVFHWHLTDDQGWRFASKKFPKLQEVASFGEFYSASDIREVVSYAQQLGIQVLPEIDMPGHASALAVAYPELMSAPGPYQQELRWGVHKPTLNPANEKVYEFIDQIITELTELFPFEYIHIGGDEVDPAQWNSNPDIKQFMSLKGLGDVHDLQAYFNQRLQDILSTHQRKMIGWDEVQHQNLPRDIVIQSWQGPDAVADAIHNNFQAILSTGYYLDQAQPAAYHYRIEPVPQSEIYEAPKTDEYWRSWSFSMPRKRGSPITGCFTIITAKNGEQRGFIDFKNKSRRALHNIQINHDDIHFDVDTWMGNLRATIILTNSSINGVAIVGNAPYVVAGEQIAGSNHSNKNLPVAINQPEISSKQLSLVLGGEAALWAELVDESVVDLRLWPRAFVVGERFWSAQHLQDEQGMYQRMDAIASLSRISVGVKDQEQQLVGMKKLAGKYNPQPLHILAEAVEPAQYYHRQHEKSSRATYSKLDLLNQFVDTLPAENEALRRFQQTVVRWKSNIEPTNDRDELLKSFSRWQNNYQPLLKLIEKRPALKALIPVATKVNEMATLGLFLMTRLESETPLSEVERSHAIYIINEAKKIDNELVVSVAYSVEELLNPRD